MCCRRIPHPKQYSDERTPIDKSTLKPFAALSKDDLIRMLLEAQSTIEKLSMSEKDKLFATLKANTNNRNREKYVKNS